MECIVENKKNNGIKELLSFISIEKARELDSCKKKIASLEILMSRNPKSTINEFKYNFAKQRYEQLARTVTELKSLVLEV